MSVQPYLRDGHPVAEAAFTRAACDPQRSVVVEACAGSGKTWLLVARLVRLLLAGAEPHQVLAITFTRKAAEEMRERLLEVLAQLAGGSDDAVCAALEQRGMSAADAREAIPRARGLHARVLASPGRIAIDTFHGWFGTLLRGAPLASGIVPGAMLREDALRMKREALAPFWRSLATPPLADLRAAFERLVDTVGEFNARGWIDAMFHARSEWWAFRGACDPAEVLALDLGDDARCDVLAQCLADDSMLAACRSLATRLGQGGKTEQGHANRIVDAVMTIDAWREAGAHGGEAAQAPFAVLWSAFFTSTHAPRSLRRTAALIKAAGGDAFVDGLCGEHAALCELLQDVAARCAEATVLAANLDLYVLGDALLERYQHYKGEQRAMDFGDLEWLAAKLMAQEETAAYLQVRLDARYRHLLLDEFQDTNPLQWRILRGWLDGYADPGDRPSVFLVGDPKQSIYRFRRADARLFEVARDMLVQEFDATVLRTNRTRRNRPAVLRWVNAVFDTARAEGRYPLYDTQTTALGHDGAATDDGDGGPVWLLPLVEVGSADSGASVPGQEAPDAAGAGGDADGVASVEGGDDAEDRAAHRDTLTQPREQQGDSLRFEEGRRVAAWLRHVRETVTVMDGNERRPACWRDFHLLVRRKTYLADYERAFREAGIPCLSPRRGGLLATLEALDLCALLAFLMTPESDLDLAHVLKSPLVGASDEDLAMIARTVRETSDGPRDWWTLLGGATPPPGVSAAVTSGIARLRHWLAVAPHRPVHDLIDQIYHGGEVRRRYAQAAPAALREQVLANLDAFLKLSLDLDGGRYPSLPKFIDELQAIRRGDEGESPDEGGMADDASDGGDGGEGDETDGDALLPGGGTLDAVHILTVHAAKGLEAPFVVLLDANHSDPAQDRSGILVDWPPASTVPVHFSAYGRRSERGKAREARFEAEAALAERENWNLLYVAMTRAQQGLLVSGVKGRASRKAGTGGTEIAGSWYVRLQAAGAGDDVEAYPTVMYGRSGDATATEAQIRFTDFRERYRDAPDGLIPVSAMDSDPGSAADSDGIRIIDVDDDIDADEGIVFDAAAARHGELLHALIERLTRYPDAFETIPDADAVMRWFPLAGASSPAARDEWQAQVGAAVEGVRTMLASPLLRPLLQPASGTSARNEVELYDARGRLLRIDRLVEFDDRVVIVDYKLRLLPQEHASYGAQLRRYEAAVRPMFPGKRIESGVATADGAWFDTAELGRVDVMKQASLF